MILFYKDSKKRTLQIIEIIFMVIFLCAASILGSYAYKDYRNYKQAEEYFHRAHHLMDNGKTQEAMMALEKSIDSYPYFYASYNELAAVYFLRGDYDRAMQIYDEALKFMPNHPLIYLDKSRVYYKEKDYCNAWKYISIAKKIAPDKVPEQIFNHIKRNHENIVKHECNVKI